MKNKKQHTVWEWFSLTIADPDPINPGKWINCQFEETGTIIELDLEIIEIVSSICDARLQGCKVPTKEVVLQAIFGTNAEENLDEGNVKMITMEPLIGLESGIDGMPLGYLKCLSHISLVPIIPVSAFNKRKKI